MTDAEIREAMSRYKFYHAIKLTDTISTPGNPIFFPAQELCMKYLQTLDLQGKRVLDIGCRDGLFAFAAEAAGAQEVVGIDNDISIPATEFLIPFFESNVEMHELNLYDLRPETFGKFDVVIFPGVLYHLRYPFWGLKCIRDVMNEGGHLIIETAIWAGVPNHAMLYCPVEDSPYEPSSCTFFNDKGLTDTIESLGFRTLATEPLPTPDSEKNLRALARQQIQKLKKQLANSPPDINRYVSHSVFEGAREEVALTNYWEGTHNLHSEHGGSQDIENPNEVLLDGWR